MTFDTGKYNAKDGSRTPCPLITLPLELITHIIEFVPPESHFDLAATCKFMAYSSDAVLRLHQESYTHCRVSSDIQPSTVPNLLQDACKANNSIRTWHVRSFEVWVHRDSWADWKPFCPDRPEPFNPESPTLAYSFSDEEIKTYLRLGRQHLHLSETQVDDARHELQEGGDGFLKTLLFSLCPRLRDLKIVKQEIPHSAQDIPERSLEDPAEQSGPPATAFHSLTWLKRTIWNTIDGESYSWPPGYLALHDVAVGLRSGKMREDSASETGSPVSFEVLCSLLRLPNIESVYFNNWSAFPEEVGIDLDDDMGGDEEAESSWRIFPGCSSVEHLYLDEVSLGSRVFSEAIINAPKHLLSISYRAGSTGDCEHMDRVMEWLIVAHSKSLQSLMFYGDRFTGYRCTLYPPNEGTLGYDDLRHLTVDAGDIFLDFGCQFSNKDEAVEALEKGFDEQFPESLEVLNLVGDAAYYTHFDWDALDALDDCLVRIIESDKWKNLKAIYLERVEVETAGAGGKPKTKFAFQHTVAASRKRGVDVYTVYHKDRTGHPINFPVAPDKFDLVTGPFRGPRPRDGSLKLNLYNGVWEPSGCDYCGKCEDCFQVYPGEVWRSLRGA